MGAASNGRYVEKNVSTKAGAETLTAVTANANGNAFDIEDAAALVAKLDITARTGTTPTLDVKLQGRTGDASAPWTDIASFAQMTAVAATERAFPVAGWKQGRWVKTVGGTTPSFTGSITVSKVRR